jgi:hypothetical protein
MSAPTVGRFGTGVSLSELHGLHDAAERLDLFSKILAGKSGCRILNGGEAKIVVQTTLGDVEIILQENEWRAIATARAQTLRGRLEAAGVEAPDPCDLRQ